MKNKKRNIKNMLLTSTPNKCILAMGYVALSLFAIFLLWFSWGSNTSIAENNARIVSSVAKNTLDIDKVSLLNGTKQDENTEHYKEIQSSLYSIAASDRDIQFAYLYAMRDGKLYFLADSEPTDSTMYISPGQEYMDANDTYYEPFETGKTTITSIIKDARGTRISVLTPVTNDSGTLIAVFGMDYAVLNWCMIALTGFAKTLGIVLMVFLFAFTIHALINRNYSLSVGQAKLKKANEIIRISEEKYRNMFEYSPVGIFNFDTNGRVVDCNDFFVGIIGSSRKVLVGLDLLSLPDAKMAECIRAVLRGEISEYNDTYQSVTADKKTPIFGKFAPIFSPTGTIIGGTGFLEDETQRKKLLDELHLKSLVMDQLEEHITITDLHGVITYINRIQSDVFGYTPQDILGKKTDIFGEDTPQGASQKEILEKTLTNGSWAGEVINQMDNGKTALMECRTQLIYDNNKKPIALGGIAIDITQRKIMEQDLYNEKEKFRTTLLSVGDGVIATDAQGKITVFNAVAEHMTG